MYRQLVDQARRLIAAGTLAPGEPLPSVRNLAQALALNPLTISKAYTVLEGEGLIVRVRGRGIQVLANAARGSAREALLIPALMRAAQEARELGLEHGAVVRLFPTILATPG